MKDSTKIKVAIEAIEQQQRKFVFEANMYRQFGHESAKKSAEEYDRLEEAKKFLQAMLQK